MKLSQKDKSLIIFISALLIVIWGIFSLFSTFSNKSVGNNPDLRKVISASKDNWHNVYKRLDEDLLEDKIVVLDFWNHRCFKCLSHISKIKKIINSYENKVVFIGVHSTYSINENYDSSLSKSIAKHNIDFPVIDDRDQSLLNHFGIKSWPKYFIIDPRGNLFKSTDDIVDLESSIQEIYAKYRFSLSDSSLPMMPVGDLLIDNVMKFPTKITFTKEYYHEGKKIPALIIANSGKNTIVISNLSGKILQKIGSGVTGFVDGDLNNASFNGPTSTLFHENKIYLTDSGNNAIRVVDLKKKIVSTIIGSGEIGGFIKPGKKYSIEGFDLAYPSDIEFFPTKNTIVIANSATNQILSYNIALSTISLLAGNGDLGMDDNIKAQDGTLAQSADLFPFLDKLYFVDSKSAALRYVSADGELRTLIGKGVANFGFKDGDKLTALMNNPRGLDVDENGIYIVDSFNSAIRRYDFKTSKLSTVIQKLKLSGSNISTLDQPTHLLSVFDKFYISDTYNNRILSVNRINFKSEIFDIMPQQKIYKDLIMKYKPSASEKKVLKSGEVNIVKIKVKDGWRINSLGPSYLTLLKIGEKEAELIDYINWEQINTKEIEIDDLDLDSEYALSGKIYYCEDKNNSLCYIKNYDARLIAKTNSKNNLLTIEIGN